MKKESHCEMDLRPHPHHVPPLLRRYLEGRDGAVAGMNNMKNKTYEITPDLIARFEAKFIPEPNSGCWLWLAYARPNKGTTPVAVFMGLGEQNASRVSFRIYKGPIPPGMVIRHTCDNTYCVNPDHLLCGTQKENVHDTMRRGRRRDLRGENIGNSKYRLSQVIEIKLALRSGITPWHLAKKLNIPDTTIRMIKVRWPEGDEAIAKMDLENGQNNREI